MIINDLKLPNSFIETLRKGKFRREVGCWHLREEVDAYGNHLESELCELYETEYTLIRETTLLSNHFAADGYYGEQSEWQDESVFVSDITRFLENCLFCNIWRRRTFLF